MKHTKIVTIPARESTQEEVYDYTSCDICKSKLKFVLYETDAVEMKHEKGPSYPEGTHLVQVQFDVCGKCFTELVLPFMAGLGATPRVSEIDY